MRCNAGHGCTVSCRAGCGCAYVHGTGECYCFCSEGGVISSPEHALALSDTINFVVSGLPVERAIEHLSALTKIKIHVPSSEGPAGSLALSNVTVAEALHEVLTQGGLVASEIRCEHARMG